MRTISSMLAAVLLSLCACGGGTGNRGLGFAGTGGGGTGPAPDVTVFELSPTVNRDLDVVFVVDNSAGTGPLQAKLAAGFGAYAEVLKNLPGGLPNLHLAVVSSDIGAGVYDSDMISNCRHGGDQGVMQNQPRGTSCAAGSLMPGQFFISNVNGLANYTGSLEDTFRCISALGNTGCGFEHQFGSLLRALGADGNGGAPAENANFLRPNAFLSIVIVTDEDDCSAPINSRLFDPTSRYVSDPLGPLTSYRCNEYGHLCGGQRPPRSVSTPVDLSGTCTSVEDGRLLRVADVAAALKQLKTDPSKVLVAAIAGPPTPYIVDANLPTLADEPSPGWASIKHSCTTADGTTADPAIRIRELVDAFAGNGVFQSTCDESLLPAVQRVAEEVGKKMAAPCVGKVVDANPSTTVIEPDCTAIDHTGNDAGFSTDVPLRSCASSGGVPPCWELAAAGPTCPSGQSTFRVLRATAPAEVSTTLRCKLCAANDPRPGCAYFP